MIRMKLRLNQSINSEYGGSTSSFRKTIAGLIKRTFDFTAALIGLILLSPFFGLIAILIKRDSPGPVFYWGNAHWAAWGLLQNAQVPHHV